jgi:uncharacterized protein YqjF (DUF2071 family)
VSFLHWPIDADRLGPLLPDVLVPDLVDGSAWVAITPFRVDAVRVLGGPPMPLVAPFVETNVRTYVRHRDGRDGLWFLSLDVSSMLNAVCGRAVAPYFLSAMSVDGGTDGRVTYRCRRRIGPAAHHRITVLPGRSIGASAVPGRVAGLTGRWRAFTRIPGAGVVDVPVQHEPWPLQEATLVDLDETLLLAAGLPLSGDPMVHHAAGVDARLGAPRRPGQPALRKRRRRRLFETTKTLERAMAAPASMGLR